MALTNLTPRTKRSIRKIGIIAKRDFKTYLPLIKEVTAYCKKLGKEVLFDSNIAPILVKEPGLHKTSILRRSDMVIVMGGDGTLLKTARRLSRVPCLILGVNIGTVGFLSETTPEKLLNALDTILVKGKYFIDTRSVLRVTHYRDDRKIDSHLALNDAVINQGNFARLIEMQVDINQQRVATFRADGLIVATPTGSTGHALSAGGPIVNPALPAFVLVPICPATLANRPIIIPNDRQIRITIATQRREIRSSIGLTIDGQLVIPLRYGDEIKIRKSEREFQMVRLKWGRYYRLLHDKLHWGKI